MIAKFDPKNLGHSVSRRFVNGNRSVTGLKLFFASDDKSKSGHTRTRAKRSRIFRVFHSSNRNVEQPACSFVNSEVPDFNSIVFSRLPLRFVGNTAYKLLTAKKPATAD